MRVCQSAKRQKIGDRDPAHGADPQLAPTSTTWAQRLLEAHEAITGSSLPMQGRKIIMESVCTGIATHAIGLKVQTAMGLQLLDLETPLKAKLRCVKGFFSASKDLERSRPRVCRFLVRLRAPLTLQEIGLEFIDRLGCDRKPLVAQFFTQSPTVSPKHLSTDLQKLAETGPSGFACAFHSTPCDFTSDEAFGKPSDILCAGPPCSPYSQQRSSKQEVKWLLQRLPPNL